VWGEYGGELAHEVLEVKVGRLGTRRKGAQRATLEELFGELL
jgi:hypothetical protein